MSQSSELAGGDGFTFEGHVGGMYLSALLAKRKAVGCDGIVINVATQQRDFSEPLDDIIVQWKDKSDRTGTTSLQVKRKLIISDAKKNKDFRSVIKDSWLTFFSPNFVKDLDKFGTVVGYIADSKLRAFRLLCESAKESNNPSHFEIRFTSSGNASKEQREIKKVIENIIAEENKKTPTNEEIHMFLSHFIIIQFDALHSGETGSNIAELNIKEFLGKNSHENETLVLAHLITNFRTSAGKSGQYDRERLLNELKKVIPINSDKLVGTKTKFLEDSSNYIQNKFTKIPILGSRAPISLNSCWIPLKATIVESESYNSTNLEIALKNYHDFHQLKKRDQITIDASTFGRFVKKAVILGGPGIGKSTLLKKLALDYSAEGKLVIFVKLSTLLTYLEDKALTFEESLLRCAFENSLNLINDSSIFENAIILGDGLDECGKYQKKITDAFHLFSQRYSGSQILLSSRPIGYISGLLGDWRHYQLQPIDDNEIYNAVTKIIKALPYNEVGPLEEKVNIVQDQINSKYVKGLASRSPLILTLMSVLVSQSTEVATNRASLYRKFFNLIQKNTTDRDINDLPDLHIRLNFLYALGFILYSQDVPLFEEINEKLLNILKKQFGGSTLETKKIINECTIYWEEMGVIEQVHTLTESTITFIHKTFCEFTFAKYIVNQEDNEKIEIFKLFYNDPNFIEVVSFLSHLGLGNKIIEFLNTLSVSDKKIKLSQYLETIIEASVDWDNEQIDDFLDLCWKETKNIYSSHRYSAGAALCLASSRCWVKLKNNVKLYLDDNDEWIKLVALTCMLSNSKKVHIDYNLVEALYFFKLNFPKNDQPQTTFRIGYYSPLNKIRDLFLKNITEILLFNAHNNSLYIDELNKFYLEENISISAKLSDEIGLIFKKYNYKFLFGEKYNPVNTGIFDHLTISNECNMNFLSILLFNTDIKDLKTNNKSEKFIELGAFIHLSEMLESPFTSINIFKYPAESSQDLRVVLFKKIAEVSNIDYSKLQEQANLKLINYKNKDDCFSLFSGIPSVDIEINYENQKISSEIIPFLEKSILTGNDILARIALKLSLFFIGSLELKLMVENIIKLGRGRDLAFSAHLGNYIENQDFQKIILNKIINLPVVHGNSYLYPHLDEDYNKELFLLAIYKGLDCNYAHVAEAAAEKLVNIDADKLDLDKLKEYYKQWKLKELPYPIHGGTVPQTPRDKLAEFILKLEPNNLPLLQEMATDDRPNIRKLSINPLINIAKENSNLRNWLIDQVLKGNLKIDFLEKSISENVYFDDYTKILNLLENSDDKIRYTASLILKHNYIPRALIKEKAKLLLNDSMLYIRELAHNLLNKL